MTETLYRQLRAINDIPDYIEVDKPKEYREVFQDWQERSDLVKMALEGELTLPQDFDELKEKLGWFKDFYPHTIDEELKQRVRGYEEVGGWLGQESNNNLVVNPVSSGLMIAFGGAAMGCIIKPNSNRREFLKFASVLGVTGAIFGLLGPWVKYVNKESVEHRLSFIQQKIDEYASLQSQL